MADDKRTALLVAGIGGVALVVGAIVGAAPGLVEHYLPRVAASPIACATEQPPSGVEAVQVWLRENEGCWTTVLPPVNKSDKIEMQIRYSNEEWPVRHNVLVRLTLPIGVTIDPSTQLLKNSNNQNARAVDENLSTTGVNTGDYAKGADVYIKVNVDLSQLNEKCGLQTHDISVDATTTDNTLAVTGAGGFETNRNC